MQSLPLALLLLASASFFAPDRVSAEVDKEVVTRAIQRCTMLPEGRDTILQDLANDGWVRAVPAPELTDAVESLATFSFETTEISQSPEFAAALATTFVSSFFDGPFDLATATAEELRMGILDGWYLAMDASVNPDIAAGQPFLRTGSVTLGVLCLSDCDEYFSDWCILSGPTELAVVARNIDGLVFEDISSEFPSPFSVPNGLLNGAIVSLGVFDPAEVVERIEQLGGVRLPYLLKNVTAAELVTSLNPVSLWISQQEEIE